MLAADLSITVVEGGEGTVDGPMRRSDRSARLTYRPARRELVVELLDAHGGVSGSLRFADARLDVSRR